MKNIVFAIYFIFPQNIIASNTEKVGDIFLYFLPTLAYGTTYYIDDKEGQGEMEKSFATNVALTYAFKYSIKKERPNKINSRSFPSGHTSTTFQSASFIHKRYGLEYATPFYLLATYTGYSRVYTKYHYTSDVLAGATLGILSSFYFTTKYRKIKIQATSMGSGYGVTFKTRW